MVQTLDTRPAVTSRTTATLREFGSYEEAQQLVDRLSDAGFPVEQVRIVGTGLRSVEQVTGRLTKGRAAAGGALTGAGFGLLIGLLFAVFVIGPFWVGVVLSSVIFGALWGRSDRLRRALGDPRAPRLLQRARPRGRELRGPGRLRPRGRGRPGRRHRLTALVEPDPCLRRPRIPEGAPTMTTIDRQPLRNAHRFTLYPMFRVAAILDDADDTRTALDTLEQAGVDLSTVDLLTGREEARALGRTGRRRGWGARQAGRCSEAPTSARRWRPTSAPSRRAATWSSFPLGATRRATGSPRSCAPPVVSTSCTSIRGTSPFPRSSGRRGDLSGEVPGAVAVVDVDHPDPGAQPLSMVSSGGESARRPRRTRPRSARRPPGRRSGRPRPPAARRPCRRPRPPPGPGEATPACGPGSGAARRPPTSTTSSAGRPDSAP